MVEDVFVKSGQQVQHLGGAYLIFARSHQGGHFAGQAPKPVTRNVPTEHFGKSREQVQHLGGCIWFLSGLVREVFLKVGPQSLSQKLRPRDIWEKVGSRSNT